ncbi:MAG TPA: GFA family protein [Burkholderiaceae bacterium]|nr:GFA family protein [Burkholderiaceae bacterium]
MTQQNAPVAGGCLCGAVRFELTGALRGVVLCHCAMCRKTHGHIGAYTNVPKAALHLTEARGLKWYSSSNVARRGFCSECGASLFWERPAGDLISIAAGTLDPPTGLTTTLQIFTDSAGDYYSIDPSVAQRKN